MNKPWKVARAFLNNGPDYFVVTNGTWGARKIACLDEPSAETVRDLLAALELANATIKRLEAKHGGFSSVQGTLDVADAAIAKAKGHE
jgi:hypothetical protein